MNNAQNQFSLSEALDNTQEFPTFNGELLTIKAENQTFNTEELKELYDMNANAPIELNYLDCYY